MVREQQGVRCVGPLVQQIDPVVRCCGLVLASVRLKECVRSSILPCSRSVQQYLSVLRQQRLAANLEYKVGWNLTRVPHGMARTRT